MKFRAFNRMKVIASDLSSVAIAKEEAKQSQAFDTYRLPRRPDTRSVATSPFRKSGLLAMTKNRFFAPVIACAAISCLCLQAGCQPGIVALLGTPTSAESEIPAEYDLTQQKDQKILVLVDQPSYLNAHANLRYFLTDTVNKMLQMRLKIQPEFLIDYDKLAEFRSSTPDFSLLSPDKIGSALGADLVLLIVVNDCRVSDIGQTGYLSGELNAEAQLIRTSSGEKLWPTLEQAKAVKVGFESERRGQDAAAVRLVVAAAHCVTRYLYNAPKNQFKISDEVTNIGWENN
ncbi:MAG: hypothetical protein ABII09_02665 [Planctomycetota bacterium]